MLHNTRRHTAADAGTADPGNRSIQDCWHNAHSLVYCPRTTAVGHMLAVVHGLMTVARPRLVLRWKGSCYANPGV